MSCGEKQTTTSKWHNQQSSSDDAENSTDDCERQPTSSLTVQDRFALLRRMLQRGLRPQHLARSVAMWRRVAFRRLPGKAVNASASARRYAHNVMIGDDIDTCTALENV